MAVNDVVEELSHVKGGTELCVRDEIARDEGKGSLERKVSAVLLENSKCVEGPGVRDQKETAVEENHSCLRVGRRKVGDGGGDVCVKDNVAQLDGERRKGVLRQFWEDAVRGRQKLRRRESETRACHTASHATCGRKR